MERFIIISGCSGGGKSTLLAELARRGFSTVPEPGRRIVITETECGGSALPWIDLKAFLDKAIALALADLEQAAAMPGRVFFDRGLFDAASGLQALTGEPWIERLRLRERFGRVVFMAPPWSEIYVTDSERRHDVDAARAEYQRLLRDYPLHGFTVVELPRLPVEARADFISAYDPLAKIGP